MNGPINFEKFKKEDGVYILSDINSAFESTYLKVREKEKRIYSNDELKILPFASVSNQHKKEWKLRAKSLQRFRKYLGTKEYRLNILDLGCGNGWFSGQLSRSLNHNFYNVDVNLTELKQGRRVFTSEQIKFIYSDIFTAEFPKALFKVVIVNAAIQYFPDLKKLLEKLFALITADGEIHIIDSPFYFHNEVKNARKRTADYYNSIGFPEMTNNYFHHTFHELSDFKTEILYNPFSVLKKLGKIFLTKDSPFPWIRIKK